ncbi:hypothetical protein SNEBB_008897 [Seison nebaliae]|nr:hypothetical protein SNEBB_008897 [Seison nebaliae]
MQSKKGAIATTAHRGNTDELAKLLNSNGYSTTFKDTPLKNGRNDEVALNINEPSPVVSDNVGAENLQTNTRNVGTQRTLNSQTKSKSVALSDNVAYLTPEEMIDYSSDQLNILLPNTPFSSDFHRFIPLLKLERRPCAVSPFQMKKWKETLEQAGAGHESPVPLTYPRPSANDTNTQPTPTEQCGTTPALCAKVQTTNKPTSSRKGKKRFIKIEHTKFEDRFEPINEYNRKYFLDCYYGAPKLYSYQGLFNNDVHPWRAGYFHFEIPPKFPKVSRMLLLPNHLETSINVYVTKNIDTNVNIYYPSKFLTDLERLVFSLITPKVVRIVVRNRFLAGRKRPQSRIALKLLDVLDESFFPSITNNDNIINRNTVFVRQNILGIYGVLSKNAYGYYILCRTISNYDNEYFPIMIRLEKKERFLASARTRYGTSKLVENPTAWKKLCCYYHNEKNLVKSMNKVTPYLVEPLWIDSDGKYRYIALEWADCGNLHQFLINYRKNNGGCPIKNLWDFNVLVNTEYLTHIFSMIVVGLEQLHSFDVCHNDLSLSDILVYSSGKICLSNFHSSRPIKFRSIYATGTLANRSAEKHFTTIFGGYNYLNDFYNLGIILSQIFYTTLFNPELLAPWDEVFLYLEALDFNLPGMFVPNSVKTLIQLLCKPHPMERLCCFDKLKTFSTFSGTKWALLQSGQYVEAAPEGYLKLCSRLRYDYNQLDPEGTHKTDFPQIICKNLNYSDVIYSNEQAPTVYQLNNPDYEVTDKLVYYDKKNFLFPRTLSIERTDNKVMCPQYNEGLDHVHVNTVRQIRLGYSYPIQPNVNYIYLNDKNLWLRYCRPMTSELERFIRHYCRYGGDLMKEKVTKDFETFCKHLPSESDYEKTISSGIVDPNGLPHFICEL